MSPTFRRSLTYFTARQSKAREAICIISLTEHHNKVKEFPFWSLGSSLFKKYLRIFILHTYTMTQIDEFKIEAATFPNFSRV